MPTTYSNLVYSCEARLIKHLLCTYALQNLSYGDRLRELGLYSVKGRLVPTSRSYLYLLYWKIFHGKSCIPSEQGCGAGAAGADSFWSEP